MAINPIQSLKPFDFAQAVARAGLGVDGKPLGAAQKAGAPEGGFATAMTQALKSVSGQQMEAQRLQRELQLDNPAVSLKLQTTNGGIQILKEKGEGKKP